MAALLVLPFELAEMVAECCHQQGAPQASIASWWAINGLALRRQGRACPLVPAPLAVLHMWKLTARLDFARAAELARRLRDMVGLPAGLGRHCRSSRRFMLQEFLAGKILNRTAYCTAPAAEALRETCAQYTQLGCDWVDTLEAAALRGDVGALRQWLPRVRDIDNGRYERIMAAAAERDQPAAFRWLAENAPEDLSWGWLANAAVEGDSPECFAQCLAAGYPAGEWASAACRMGHVRVMVVAALHPTATRQWRPPARRRDRAARLYRALMARRA